MEEREIWLPALSEIILPTLSVTNSQGRWVLFLFSLLFSSSPDVSAIEELHCSLFQENWGETLTSPFSFPTPALAGSSPEPSRRLFSVTTAPFGSLLLRARKRLLVFDIDQPLLSIQ